MSDIRETPSTNGNAPDWAQTLKRRYLEGVAHAFVLHGNVNDYVAGDTDLRTYLALVFAKRDVVCFYNRAEGITFPRGAVGDGMKEKFVAALGIGGDASEMAAFSASIGGESAGTSGEHDLPREPSQALPLLDRLLRLDDLKAAVVLDYAETLCP